MIKTPKIFQLKSKNIKKKLNELFKWNAGLAGLHFMQGVAVLVLSQNTTFPLSTSFLSTDGMSSAEPSLFPATTTVYNINLVYLVAVFFFMSAVAHLWLASYGRDSYEKNLKKGMNKTRWFEYALSASTMMVAIAILAGVYDMSGLVMIFALTAFMNMMGLVMEVTNQKAKSVNWLTFIIGSVAGIIPWLVIGLYFIGTDIYGSGQIPAFVYWIFGSLFLFFNCFAINMYLGYRRTGNWKDYFYTERVYMVLSLVAKSALAWQVFFGALRP